MPIEISPLDKETRERWKELHIEGKVCRSCGKKNPEDATHCRKCGYSKPDYADKPWYRRRKDVPRG